MAPTEVLARQHAETLERLLAGSHARLGAADRRPDGQGAGRSCSTEIAAGEVEIVVGTQAIISDDVPFAQLGLVVIDEQHKFGVRQRAALAQARPSIRTTW